MFCQEERNGEGKFKKIKNKYYSFPLIAPFNPHSPIHGHSQPLILARLSTPPPTAPPNKCAHCVVILGSTKLEEITTKSAPATKVFDEGLAKEDIFMLLDSCFMDPLCLQFYVTNSNFAMFWCDKNLEGQFTSARISQGEYLFKWLQRSLIEQT